MPLYVGFNGVPGGQLNFNCYMRSVLSLPSQPFYEWYFDAAPGHIDGQPSSIYFDLYETADGTNTLGVTGYVQNATPGGLPQPIYVAAAASNWSNFAANLRS